MQAKASKIVILCYYLSILCLINCYKNIQNITNCLLRPAPPGGGGVWCVGWHEPAQMWKTTNLRAATSRHWMPGRSPKSWMTDSPLGQTRWSNQSLISLKVIDSGSWIQWSVCEWSPAWWTKMLWLRLHPCWIEARKRGENQSHDHVTPPWGEECRLKSQQNSDIVLLCIYFLSK